MSTFPGTYAVIRPNLSLHDLTLVECNLRNDVIHALTNGNHELLNELKNQLLNHKFNVDIPENLINIVRVLRAVDEIGHNILHIASRSGQHQTVTDLLAIGAYVRSTPFPTTPGSYGFEDYYVAINTEIRDNEGRTALMLAAEGGMITVKNHGDSYLTVKALMEGVAIHPPGRPFVNQIGPGSSAVCEKNRMSSRVTARNRYGLSVLHFAALNGSTKVIQYLLDRRPRAPLDAETNDEDRALHLAALGGHAEACLALLQHGADPDRQNCNMHTALHLATLGGPGGDPRHVATTNVLTGQQWRCSLNIKDSYGQTPLMIACQYGHINQVKAILAAPGHNHRWGGRSADIRLRREGDGRTALHIAANEGFNDVCQLLLTADSQRESSPSSTGADAGVPLVLMRDVTGRTASDLASQQQHSIDNLMQIFNGMIVTSSTPITDIHQNRNLGVSVVISGKSYHSCNLPNSFSKNGSAVNTVDQCCCGRYWSGLSERQCPSMIRDAVRVDPIAIGVGQPKRHVTSTLHSDSYALPQSRRIPYAMWRGGEDMTDDSFDVVHTESDQQERDDD